VGMNPRLEIVSREIEDVQSIKSIYDDDGHPSVRLHPHVDAVCIGVFKIEILTPSLNGDRDSIERER